MTACPDCGIDNESSADRCTSCGAQLDNAAARALIGQTVLGVYRILEVVGKGGMSVVYKARHKMTDQLVALKILPAELAVHDDIKARFLEEAKALAKLEHPHIVRLYNFGEEGGRFVLAMQYVDGTTFERKIFEYGAGSIGASATRIDWREACDVARQVLLALDYAHGRGIVHRDIKPSNILVRADGSAMVMDFGIAKMAEGSGRLTATGQTMGTVRYMSPEQVRGQIVDHRSDLYSLGATLFEGVVGDTPFDGATHFEIMMKHLNEAAPSLLGRGIDVPADLDKVVKRSLAKLPADRYQRAGDFREDLEKLLDGKRPSAAASSPRPTPGPPPSPPKRDVESGFMTGLAHKLEPDEALPIAARRPRVAARFGVAAVVVAGSAGGLWALRHRPANQADAASSEPAPAPAVRPAEAGAWPDPSLVPGVAVAVDQRFAAPELLRVLSPHPVDTAAVARAYVAARARFTEWAAKTYGATVEQRPLNLVLAAPETVCAAVTRFAKSPAPSDCADKPPRFYYAARGQTLFVLDDDRFLARNLPEGTAQHLCFQTEALLEKGCGKTILPPYWDEVEKK